MTTRKGLLGSLAIAAVVLLGGCAGQTEMDSLRADLDRTQEMTRALQQDATSLRRDTQQATQAANAAAQSAREAAAEARAARESAQLAAEKAERIQRSSLRK